MFPTLLLASLAARFARHSDLMSNLGVGGGLSPKASIIRRNAYDANRNELESVQEEIIQIISKGLESYKRGQHRTAVLTRLRFLRKLEEELCNEIAKEKASDDYQEKYFSFAFLQAEVKNIASSLSSLPTPTRK